MYLFLTILFTIKLYARVDIFIITCISLGCLALKCRDIGVGGPLYCDTDKVAHRSLCHLVKSTCMKAKQIKFVAKISQNEKCP